MAEYSKEKFYWLKLRRDFFKRHDVRILEAQDNGKDYVLFYLKLLLESIDHQGELRFNDMIPYDEKMLSTITDTNVDIVRAAMQVLRNMGLVEVLDDKTIYLKETKNMMGAQTKGAERRERQRINASNKTRLLAGETTNVTPMSQKCHPEIEIEIEKDIEKDIKNICAKAPKNAFKKPTIEEIEAYCKEKGYSVNANVFWGFYESKGWVVGKAPMKSWKGALTQWHFRDAPEPKSNKFAAYKKVSKRYVDGVLVDE